MSVVLSPLMAFASLSPACALETVLWTGVAFCVASIARRRRASASLTTSLAFGMAIVLGSLALVAP